MARTRRAEALHRRCPAIVWEGGDSDSVRARVVVLSTASASSPDAMDVVVEVGGGKDAMGQPRWRAIPLQPGAPLPEHLTSDVLLRIIGAMALDQAKEWAQRILGKKP